MALLAPETLDAPPEIPLTDLELIQENKYCAIYRARLAGRPVIVKKYRGEDPSLMLAEAAALDQYHAMAGELGLADSGTLAVHPERNLLLIAFVPGVPLTEVVRAGRRPGPARERALRHMRKLGHYLATLRRRTLRPGEPLDPFHFEYIRHSSRRLAEAPLGLGRFFRQAPAQAELLIRALEAAAPVPSAVHGDLVFRNIHADGERTGLIDFANALTHSHTLNDLYNLHFALQNMLLPRAWRRDLWAALLDGLGELPAAPAVHRFFFEYHRRRWLALKLHARRPVARLEAVRGLLLGFARSAWYREVPPW